MNILLFVIAMLMLMTLMTYSKLESYRNFAILQSQFEFYMRNLERMDYTQSAKKCYKANVASKKEQDENEKEKNSATSKLSLHLFVNKEDREKYPQVYSQYLMLAKNLINILYGEAEFFKKAKEKDDGIVDTLLKEIGDQTAELPKKEQISSICDLSRINFEDSNLQTLFYSMLSGGVEIPKEEQGTVNVQRKYPPLGKYITLENKSVLRVYLASKELLLAIFEDPEVVEDIIQKRNELYLEVDSKRMSAEEASSLFKNQFENRRINGLISDVLDFGVSKTDPKSYT